MTFARRVYRVAGIYGLVVLFPLYFLESRIGAEQPPAVTHPEYYYGFVGVGLAWQVAFLILATDPIRYRPLMIATVLEKATFGLAAIALFAAGRLPGPMLAAGLIDLTFGALFVASYLKTAPAGVAPSA